MTAAPPPNWYPDPHDKAQLRWWDGSQWTEHRHPAVGITTTTQPSPEESSTERSSTEQSSTAAAPATAQEPTTAVEPVVDQWAVAPRAAAPVAAGSTSVFATEAPHEAQSAVAPAPTPDKPIDETLAREQWAQRRESWGAPTTALPALITVPESSPTHKNRKPMIIGAAVVALLVVGAIAFLATRGGDDKVGQSTGTTVATTTSSATTRVATTATNATTTTTRSTATTVATTVGSTLPGTTFSDAANVYRVRVAPTWQDVTTAGGLQTWTTGTSSAQFKDQVNVLIEKLPSDISMDDYLAASVKNAPKSLPSFVEVGRSVSTVNGKVLGQLDFRSTQNGVALRHRAVVLIKARNAIVITYTAEPGRFDAESANVQPYLTSVEGV